MANLEANSSTVQFQVIMKPKRRVINALLRRLWGVGRSHDHGHAFNAQLLHQTRALDLWVSEGNAARMISRALDPGTLSEIIEMALNNHCRFDQIRALHGLAPMRKKRSCVNI